MHIYYKTSNVIKKPYDVRRRNSSHVTINCDVVSKYHCTVIQNGGLWWNKMSVGRNIRPIFKNKCTKYSETNPDSL